MFFGSPAIRQLDPFSVLKADGGFSIELIKSNEHALAISVSNFDPSNIIISTARQTLYIYPKPGGYHNFSVNIQLRFVRLSSLVATGSTTVLCKDEINSDEFTIQQSGSGIIQLSRLHVRKLSITSSGSGKIWVGGEAKQTIIQLNGAGLVNTSDLKTETLKTKVKGSGIISGH